jgi:glycosyltransferase involved in cell wall biosynthesis
MNLDSTHDERRLTETVVEIPLLSVVVPVHNEADNLTELHNGLSRVLRSMGKKYEVVYVDDGSTDDSLKLLSAISEVDETVTVIQLRRNFGQTSAMSAGIDLARGDILIFMDGDLQNDPGDIPRLLAKLEEGYDVVSGWRKDRKDGFLLRRLPSLAANRLISWTTGVHLQDYGCTLKAYRRGVFEHIRLYGEMHRFIPVLAEAVGASVAEIPVNHRSRRHGISHYGLGRTFRVFLDLLTVKFLSSFSGNPIYLFGGSGLVLITLSLVTGLAMLLQKVLYGVSFIQTPLLLLAAMLFILGFQSILLGLTAEMLVRTYHESQGKPIYVIRRIFKSGR